MFGLSTVSITKVKVLALVDSSTNIHCINFLEVLICPNVQLSVKLNIQ